MNSNWLLVLFGVILTLTILALIWDLAVRRISLREFGMHLVIDTLQWQPDHIQQAIYSRGSLTKAHWYVLRRLALKHCRKELA